MRGFKIFLITTLSCFFYFSAEAQTNYFNVTGSTDPTLLSSWTLNSNGTVGTQPTSFTANNQRFNIRANTSMTLNSSWTINGSGTSLWISGTLTVNSGGGVNLASGSVGFSLRSNGTYVHNTSTDIGSSGQLLNRYASATSAYSFLSSSNLVFSASGTHTIPNVTNTRAIFQLSIIGSGTYINMASGSSVVLNNGSGILNIDPNAVLDFNEGSRFAQNIFTTSGSGLLRTAITSDADFPPVITWSFPVEYYSSDIQTIQGGTYQDLICSGGIDPVTTQRIIVDQTYITVNGTFTTCPSHLMGYIIGEDATFEFTSPGNTVIPIIPYQNLTLSNTGQKSINGDLEVFGFFNIQDEDTRLVLNGNDVTFYNSTIMNGSLVAGPNSTLRFVGDFSAFDDSELRLSQDNPGENVIRSLEINKDVNTVGVMILAPVYINYRLSLFSGVLLMADDDVHLLSSSITNTAQVDPVTNDAGINYTGVGRIVAERHIPLGKRAYRDLSSSGIYTDGSFIFENWQEGGSLAPNYGTQITGVTGTPNSVDPVSGLDRSTSGNTSMHMQINGSWTGNDVLNTRTRRLNPFQGYRIFIRGDRTHNLAMLPTPVVMTTATTLRARGRLVYGDITYNSSGINSSRGNSTVLGVASLGYSMNAAQNGFSFVANPFPAIVDWEAIVSSSTNIQSTYWYWDPALGTQGAFATYTVGGTTNPVTSPINRFIQPGMAIFTRNANISSPNPQLRINEAHKNPDQTLRAVFQTASSPTYSLPAVIRKRVDNEWVVMDGITLRTGDQFNNQIDTREDVFKLNNPTENIAIVADGGRLLSVDSRKPIKEASRIPFRLWLTQSGQQYEWTFYQPKTMKEVTDLLPVLDDRFTGKQQLLWGDSTTYRFTVTQDTGSFNHRFSLLFKAPQPALVQPDIQLAATDLGDAHQLAFRASNQDGIAYFNIESSKDGRNYQFLHTLPATGASAYSWKTNVNPADGQRVYYRIQQMSSDATFGYSNIAQLDKEQGRVPFQIYPNPVVGRTVQIQLMDLPKGRYFLQAAQENGGRGDQYVIEHAGSSSVQVIELRKQVQSGVMRLQLFDSNQKSLGTRSVIVVN